MVTNLGLKTEKHPSSYKISWIKQGAKVSRPESRIHDRHIGKVPYLCEPKLTYKLILQLSQSELNTAVTTKLTL
jgi:hypothetical protein